MGVNTQQNDYYESLFRRTTASYRAKTDRENGKGGTGNRQYLLDSEPSCSRQAARSKKVLNERNSGETSTSSNDLLSSNISSESQAENKNEKAKADRRSIKRIVEKSLAEVLYEKYPQDQKDQNNAPTENSTIKSIVEMVLKDKLSGLRLASGHNKSLNSAEPGSLRTIIEDVVTEILQEKLSNLKRSEKFEDRNNINSLPTEFERKLTVSKEHHSVLPREPVTHYNNNKPLDSQSLVEQLLTFEGRDNKNGHNKNTKIIKTGKENHSNKHTAGYIKRLQRSPRKKPEWQDPTLHDNVPDKPFKAIRSQSPVVSSSARSGRSKYSSSVLIRRSKSQGRKPTSDPVALYQYYKNEWEHFRKQIPGESAHGRLRWHVRQRLLDPE